MDRHITIPKLAQFLRDFTEEHRAQPVTLEVLVSATWNILESGVPLMGLDLDTRGPDAPALEIILGDDDSGDRRHLTHSVRRVRGVTVELDEDGDERRIIIEGDDGAQAVLSID